MEWEKATVVGFVRWPNSDSFPSPLCQCSSVSRPSWISSNGWKRVPGEGGTQLPALLLIGLAFGCASCQGEKQDKARIVFLLGYKPTFIVRRRTGPTLGLMRAREEEVVSGSPEVGSLTASVCFRFCIFLQLCIFFFFSCRGVDSAGYSHTRVPGARPLPSHPQQVLVCPRAHPELNHPTSNQREGLNLFAPSNHLSHLPLVSPPLSLAQPIIRPITLSTVESSRLTSERGQKRPDPENFVKSTADLDFNKLSLCSPIRPATLPSSSQRCNCYSRRLSCFIRADQRRRLPRRQ